MPGRVRDEVLVESEAILLRDARENVGGLFRRAKLNVFAALDQEAVGEVVIDGAVFSKVFDGLERKPRGLDRDGRGGDPARARGEEARRVGVGDRKSVVEGKSG